MATRPAVFRPRVKKGLWFPICLGLLVLCMLPGVILLLLSLFGAEGAGNVWLQDNLGLSYHNSLPIWATILLLALPVLLALLYFLKLRRRAMEVPSTFLWRKSIEDLHVNSLFQWLRDNVLLLVQLCIILLLIYSALEFQVHGGTTTGGQYYILLIDSSASMGVTDVQPNRLDVAKAEALKEIDSHADTDTGMVIEFNSRASILQPYTRDKGLLRAAVRRIDKPTRRSTRIDEALALADSLANPSRSVDDQMVRPAGENPAEARTYVSAEGIRATVHLYSDGRFPDVPQFSAGNLSLQYHRIGATGAEAVNNVGIVTMNAVRDEKDSSKLQVFLRVLNFRKEPARVTVELEWRQGQGDLKILSKDLDLPARVVEVVERNTPPRDTPGERAVTFDLDDVDEASDAILHARLKGWRDQFALDDEAWLVAGVVRKARVLIVTPGNEILTDFFGLEETAKVAKVTWIGPADLKDAAKYLRPARAGEYDLVIFDRCAPPDVDSLPLGNTFFIDSVPPPWQRRDMPPLKGAIIRNPASSHPLMRHLTGLDEIAFTGAFKFDLRDKRVPPRVPRLLEADRETALLFVLPRRSFQDLVLTFPLVNDRGEWTTTWNLKLSFPVFLRNVLYGLGNVSDAASEENVRPGDVKVLLPEGGAERVEVTNPEKKQRAVKRGSALEFAYQHTDEVGVYQATWPGGGRSFTVNLFDPEESNTQPRDEIKLGEQRIEAGHVRRQVHETWKWVALGALLLLVLEWAVYHRRVWF
jgi:hypothetical protein